MIASYLHKFIFIRTRKTAGTTIEMTLGPVACGPDDIVTPLGMREERSRGNGVPLFRNFSKQPELEERLRQTYLGKDRTLRQQVTAEIQFDFFHHMSAADAKQKLAPEFWETACKITAERHPYERVVSLAYYQFSDRTSEMPFEQHLDELVWRGRYSTFQHYAIDDQVIVDEFIRHESLHDDLRRIGQKLHIPIPDELPQAKTKQRKDRRPAREILSEAQKQRIYEVCSREFALHGYEP